MFPWLHQGFYFYVKSLVAYYHLKLELSIHVKRTQLWNGSFAQLKQRFYIVNKSLIQSSMFLHARVGGITSKCKAGKDRLNAKMRSKLWRVPWLKRFWIFHGVWFSLLVTVFVTLWSLCYANYIKYNAKIYFIIIISYILLYIINNYILS